MDQLHVSITLVLLIEAHVEHISIQNMSTVYNVSASIELQFLLNQSQCISANFQICVVFKMNLNYRERIYEYKICLFPRNNFCFFLVLVSHVAVFPSIPFFKGTKLV